MKISGINNNINFSGIKLANSNMQHADYVKQLLSRQGIYVKEHQPFVTKNNFESKKNILDFLRNKYAYNDYECGIAKFKNPDETWVVSNKFFEQTIKRMLDCFYVDSEINLGI